MSMVENQKPVGGFNHLEKYESKSEGLSLIIWKIKNLPNHQPENSWNHQPKSEMFAVFKTLVPSYWLIWGSPGLWLSRIDWIDLDSIIPELIINQPSFISYIHE